MNLFQRFKRFLLGVLIGLGLVFFFFGNRSETLKGWMPNERVLKRLRETHLVIPDSLRCKVECAKLDSSSLKDLFKEGNVRFRRSDTHKEPKIYCVDFDENTPAFQMYFSCDDSVSTLIEITSISSTLSCPC